MAGFVSRQRCHLPDGPAEIGQCVDDDTEVLYLGLGPYRGLGTS